MMNKKQKLSIVIYLVMIIVFQVFYFAVPFAKTSTAWVCYAFTWIALLVSYISLRVAFDGAKEIRSRVYGFPVFRIGYIYLTTQVTMGITICMSVYYVRIPMWLPLVISIILFGFAIVGIITADAIREEIQRQEEVLKQNTVRVRRLQLDLSGISDFAPNGKVKTELKKLEEEIRYSDPVSRDDLVEIENNIQYEINKLRTIINGEEENSLAQIQYIRNLLMDRNRRCKYGKQ